MRRSDFHLFGIKTSPRTRGSEQRRKRKWRFLDRLSHCVVPRNDFWRLETRGRRSNSGSTDMGPSITTIGGTVATARSTESATDAFATDDDFAASWRMRSNSVADIAASSLRQKTGRVGGFRISNISGRHHSENSSWSCFLQSRRDSRRGRC